MVRGIGCSGWLVKWANVMSMILSIPIIAVGIWLYTVKGSACETFLQTPILVIGGAIFVISLIGFVGAANGWSPILWLYLFFMAILIILLAAFTLFAFIVTADGGGATIEGYNFKEYNLADYSDWLRGEINDTSNWNHLKTCMVDTNYCEHLDEDYPTLAEYAKATLNPLESGCCRPPADCNFPAVTATDFKIVASAAAAADADCARYSNANDTMCFNCDSCKGGVAAYIKQEWQTVAIVNLVVVVLLSLLYCLGCCARYRARQPEFELLEKDQQQFASGYQRGGGYRGSSDETPAPSSKRKVGPKLGGR